MKKTFYSILLIIILLASSLTLFSCKSEKYGLDTVALVDDVDGYVEIETNDDAISYNKADILKVFNKANKYAIIAEGMGGYNGNIVIIVLIENNIIIDIKNVNNKETKEKADRVFDDNYLNQFINEDVSERASFVGGGKPSEEIDILYVTGATYSSKAVLNAVNAAILWYGTFSK